MRKKLDADFKITVDGGVTKELISEMAGQGVNEVFVGRRIFEPDLKENLKLFNNG
jgi:pentose-5-phosphate-3-epimerase